MGLIRLQRDRIMRPLFARSTGTNLLITGLSAAMLSITLPEERRMPMASGCSSPMPRVIERAPDAPPVDFVVVPTGTQQWLVNGVLQPTLTLTRGHTYSFDLTAITDEHPFLINDQNNNPFGTIYLPQAFGTTVNFTPTVAMPNNLWYHCSIHSTMVGSIVLVNPCPGDINSDLVVNSTDFGLFVSVFGTSCSGCKADINADGVVNSTDFGLFVAAFGNTCN
jgi:hypothetical protein